MDRIPSTTSQVVKKVIPENGDSISVVEGVPSPVRKQKENSIPTLEEGRVDRIPSATSQVVKKVIPENDDSKGKAETDDERTSRNEWTGTSMNEWTEIVMTMNEVETQIETYERASHEQNNDDNTCERANYEKKSDDKATLVHTEESSRSADKGKSELGEGPATSQSENRFEPREALQGYGPNWRSSVGLLAVALRQRERV